MTSRSVFSNSSSAFAAAAHVVKRRYTVSRVHAQFMEPRGAIGEWDRGGGRYTLYCDVQYPHRVREMLTRPRAKRAQDSEVRSRARELMDEGMRAFPQVFRATAEAEQSVPYQGLEGFTRRGFRRG